MQTYLPDTVGPQREAAFGNRVAANDSFYVVGAPSYTTSHVDSGEVFVYNTAGTLVSRITNPTPNTDDNFGSAVAIVGSLVVVGAWQDDFSAAQSGRAYVFQAETGAFLFSLGNPNPSSSDEFGFAVSADGNRIAVGTPGEDFVATDAGEVYVYSTAGTYQYRISNPDSAIGDRFGAALAQSGTRLVVGAPYDDTTGADSGRAYLYNNGILVATLENPSPAAGDLFGNSVTMAGNYVVVGAPSDDAGASDSGVVHLFDITTGNYVRTISNPAAAAGDSFGASVSLNGDQLLVGAAKVDDSVSSTDAGRAYLFSAATGSLLSTISNPTPQTGDEFGTAVAISSAGYVIGSPGDDAGALDAGTAQFYNATTGASGLPLTTPTLQAQSGFGSAVAISGSWYAVGSPGDDRVGPNSGEVHVYNSVTGALVREYSAPANSSEAGFGTAVAVSGNILAVGAPGLVVGGVNAGAVLLFDLSSGLFLRTIENPTPAAGDLFGKALSFKGNRLIIGSPLDDTQATDNGSAYIYDATTGALLQTLVNPAAIAGDQFGFAVTSSGDTVAIGAPYNDQFNTDHGTVFVFNAVTGALTNTLAPNFRVSNAAFGYALDLDGATLAVGAPFTDLSGTRAGGVWLFDMATGLQMGTIYQDPSPSANENSGYSVAVSGNKLIFGTPGEAAGGSLRGVVNYYDIPTHTLIQSIANPTPANDDRFGDALAIAGGRLAVGATGDSTVNYREGAAYQYVVPTLSATLISGLLTITDIGSSSTLTVVREGNDLLIRANSDMFDPATVPAGVVLENYGQTLRIPFATLSELRFTLGNGVDSLTVDVSGGDPIPAAGLTFDGGAAGTGLADSLTLTGSGQGAVTYTAATTVSGSVTFDNFGTITYSATEALQNTGDSTAATFNFSAASANAIALAGNGATGVQVSAPTMLTTVINFPTNSLTINRGNVGDTLTVGAFTSQTSLVFGAPASPLNTITFPSLLSLAADRNLTAYATGTITFTNFSSGLSLLGTGSVSLTTARDIFLTTFSSIKTKNGNINLTANPTGATSGNFAGIRVDNSAVIDSENGNVTVNGRGGTSTGAANQSGVYVNGANARISTTNGVLSVTGVGGTVASAASLYCGVYVLNGATITAGSSGVATVTGTGGNVQSSSGSANDGVEVSNAQIISTGASLVVTGTGGGQRGVAVTNGGQIAAGGSGNTTVIGTGGSAATNNKVGVYLDFGGSKITSSGGNVRVEGRGSGNTATGGNYGVSLTNAGQITAGGLGTVTVIGTGDYQNASTSTTSPNYGVYVNLSTITSSGGTVAVTGTGGGASNTSGHVGVYLTSTGYITAGGMGSVTVDGFGASPVSGSASNHGVYLVGSSRITSAGGPVTVHGTAGTATSSTASFGVFVDSTGQLGAELNGDTTVEGRAATNAGSAGGYGIINNSRIVSSGGNVVVRGWGGGAGSSSFNVGVYGLPSAEFRAAGTGSVTIEGTGGNTTGTTTSSANAGVFTSSNTQIVAVTGDITITGTGGGAGGQSNNGIILNDGTVVTTAGNVTLTGVAGTGATNLMGVQITASNAGRVNSTAGLVRITGSTPVKSVTNFGISVSNSTVGNSGSLATVELIADAIALQGSTAVLLHNSRTATLRPLTPGYNINLGVSDTPTSLGLTGAELDTITAGTIQIGDANTGDISLATTVGKGNGANVSLTPGLNRNLALNGFSLTIPTAYTLTIALTGTGALTTATAGVDFTAGTVNLTSEQGTLGAQGGSSVFVNATTLTATTLASFSLGSSSPTSTTIGPAGLSAVGTSYLAGGNFLLGGAERISDTTPLELTGTTSLALNGFDETFYSLAGASTSSVKNGGGALVNLSIVAPTGTINLLSTIGGATVTERNLRVSKYGGSTLVLGGNNTFTGQVQVYQGILSVAHPNALGSTGNPTYIGMGMSPGASLDLNGTALGAETIFLINSFPFPGYPQLFNSNVAVPASASGDLTIGMSAGGPGSITLSGKLTHAGLTKIGAGTLTLTSTTNDFTGDTLVSEGELRVNGTVNNRVLVESGATVSGTGTINSLLEARTGSRIAPGAVGAGTLTANVVVVQPGANIDLQFASAASADLLSSAASQFNLVGSNGIYPTLNLASSGGYVPTAGGKFVLIRTETGGLITTSRLLSGTGSSLPVGTVLTEGALVTDNFLGSGFPATLSYVGGVGANDIVLNVSATRAQLTSGNLVITDASAAGQADSLTVVRSGADLIISDAVNPLVALPGFTQVSINSISIPLANITGNLQVNTLAGNDSLTVDFSGGNPLPSGGLVFAGGAPTTANADTLTITGNNLDAVSIVQTTLGNGTISVGAFGTITFSSVEAIRQTGTASDLTLTPPTAAANTMTLDDDGTLANGLVRLSAATMSPVTFANPTGTVTILRGHASDVLNVGTTTATSLSDFAAGLTLGTTTAPLLTINVPAGVTLPVDRNFTAFATNPISFTNANSDWAASGTGAISLTSGVRISFVSGSSLSVVNGNLTLSANQQTPASTADSKGVDINGATISSSGTGQVTVLGRGGLGAVSPQYGVQVYGGGIIRGGTTGLTRVVGTGGASSSTDNSGVRVGNTGSGTITSLGANVEVTGQASGGTFGSGSNRGVDVNSLGGSAAIITAGGSGTVKVTGTGSTSGDNSSGVRVVSQQASITSSGGRVEVVGVGGSGGLIFEVGVWIQGGTIAAASGADLLVQGTGGAGASDYASGIVLENGSAVSGGFGIGTISVNGGNAQLIGQAGGTGSRSNGITTSGGLITAGTTGSLTISGASNLVGFSGGDWGIVFQSTLQSAGANVTLTGRGGRNNGLYFNPQTGSQLAGTSMLRLEGIHGTAGFATGLSFEGASTFTHTGTGGMQIITDRLVTSSSFAQYVFANGSITVDSYNPGVPITIGLSLDGSMEVDDQLLFMLRPATLNIGSATSGKILVNHSIVRTHGEQMNLTSGGNIAFDFGGNIRTDGGGLKLSPGPAGFSPSPTFSNDVTTSNGLTFAPGSKLNIIPVGSPQTLAVGGTVDLTGVTLNLSSFELAGPTQPLIIVENDGTDPVVGTFTGLPEGTIININGLTRKLTYVGGTGNDVELIYNRLPTLTPIPLQTVLEDTGLLTINLAGITSGTETQALQVTAANNLSYLFTDPVVTYTSPNSTGTLTFTPKPDQFGSVVVTVTVRDAGFDGVLNTPDDGLFTPTFTVVVTNINDAPSFVKGPNVTAAFSAPVQTLAAWATAISGGPNELGSTLTFNVTGNTNPGLFSAPPAVAADGTLTFTPANGAFGTATVTLALQDSGGTANGGVDTSAAQTFTITIDPPTTFQVTTFAPTSTGGVFNFSRDLDQSVLNLYDIHDGSLGASDLVLRNSAGIAIKGSALVDPSLRRITWIATNGRLPADDYTFTLRSAANGFRDTGGEQLDGDADGTAGGDQLRAFTVAPDAPGTVTIRLPNFARGPLQPVNIPANVTSGFPISFSDGEGITSANFELRYSPAILSISGATVAPGLPAGAAVTVDTSTPGLAVFQFTSPDPLPAGTTRFIDLQAMVPNGSTYREKQLLDLRNIVLNGGAIPGADDDAVQLNAYFGDASGNGTYSGTDGTILARLAAALGNGTQAFKLLDPVIIADITGNGGFSGADTTRVQQITVVMPVAEIPPRPVPAASFVLGGPDPKLSIPQDLAATAGGELTIPVHIDSIVDLTGNGLESGELVIYYDATVFEIGEVKLGSLFAGKSGWSVTARVDPLAGRVFITFSGLNPLEGIFQGELVQLHATVKADAPTGPTAINLAADPRDAAIATQLNEGWLTLIPAPTNAADDPIDGRALITANAANSATAIVRNDRLLITGTNQDDFVHVLPLANDLVRVRVNGEIVGTFAAPAEVVVGGWQGGDFVYASAPLKTTLISAWEEVDRDFVFATDPQVVTNSNTDATARLSPSAQLHELALLQLLNDSSSAAESATNGRGRLATNVRRRG